MIRKIIQRALAFYDLATPAAIVTYARLYENTKIHPQDVENELKRMGFDGEVEHINGGYRAGDWAAQYAELAIGDNCA